MVRFKNRWLLVEFLPYGTHENSQKLTSKQIWSAVRDSVLLNFGDVGWGAVGSSLNVKYYSPVTGICIIRVAREHYRIAWGAVTLLTNVEECRFIPIVVHCSGTIKKVQLAAIEHDREVVARLMALSEQGSRTNYTDYLAGSAKVLEGLQD